MAHRAPKLRKQLSQAKRTADQAQKAFLKAEDVLSDLEQREVQRQQRVGRAALTVPRRTVLDARHTFEEDVLPNVSDYQANEGRRRLEEIENAARSQADSYAAAREAEIREARDEALRELADVRDSLEALATEGRSGRLPATEYSDSLYRLRSRQQAAEATLAQAEEKLRQVEEVEADPLAWADSLMRRHPRLQPEVPW